MFRVTDVSAGRILTPCGAAAPAAGDDDACGGAGSMTEDVFECHDGANARYVGIANKWAFSSLHIAAPAAYTPSPHPGQMPSPSMCPRDTLASPASRSVAAASSTATTATLSQQLTPVHRSSLGRSPQQHTPHHSTSYDHDRYQRFLTSALLSGSETGRPSSVLSFPIRTPTRMNRASLRATPDAGAVTATTQRRTDFADHAASSHTLAHEGQQETASVLHSAVASEEWTSTLRSEEGRAAAALTEEKGCREDPAPGAYLWQPSRHVPRSGATADDVGPESTADKEATLPSAATPFAYFQRAPPVWPRPAKKLLRPPLTRGEHKTRRDASEDCGAVVLGFSAGEQGIGASTRGAVQQAQHSFAVAGVVAASACSHTPWSTHSDPSAAMGAADASFSTPRRSPSALSGVGELDRLDGVTTPLRLPSSTAQHVSFDTPPPPVPARRSLVFPVPPCANEDDADDEEDKTPMPLVSTPVSHAMEANCATPVASSSAGSPTPVRSSSGPGRARATSGASSMRSQTVRRRGAAHSALSSFTTSRQLATPQYLFTPVRHADNSIRSASVTGPSAAASGDTLLSSSSIRRPAVSPVEGMLTTAFPIAHNRGGSRRHRDGSGAHHSRTHSQAQQPQRSIRDTFQFIRALTAGEVSTDMRCRPLYWGCFGILVAQPTEVWCVGKTHPFRLFPPERGLPAWVLCSEGLEVTAVSTTERLSLAHWEASSITVGTPEAPPPVVAYAAIGSRAGDVFVYGYSKCPSTATDAIPVTLDATQAHAHSSHTVKLTHEGILRRSDRVGGGDGLSAVSPGTATLRGSPSIRDSTVSVVRIMDHWLYVGDQSGHVARYDLRHTSFLSSVATNAAPPSTSAGAAVERQDAREADPPRDPSLRLDLAMTTLPARLNPCVPIHRFGRPVLLAGASPIMRSPTLPQPVPAIPAPQPKFHYAVNVGEPVYHVEVTSNQGYLAIGTQTRLLVYRTAQLPRVPDTSPSPPLPSYSPFTVTSASTPSRNGGGGSFRVMHEHGDGPTPLVVVSDAAQPVRCFAWMLCDYESLMPSLHVRSSAEKQMLLSDTDDDDPDAFSRVPLTSDDELGIAGVPSKFGALGSACRRHTPTPSLVFAIAWQEPTELAEGQALQPPAQRIKTDIRVFRVVTHTTVTSCTLGYPVHVLAVLPGTTQIVVGTGGAVELARPVSPGAALPVGHPLPASPQVPVDAFTGLALNSPSTPPALHSTSTTAATTGPVSPVIGSRSPAIVARRPSLAVVAAEALWHGPHTVRSATRGAHSMETGAAHLQQQHRSRTGDERNGYLFLLELCPADGLAGVRDTGEDCCVCLRVRGEVGVGEGESAVCGAMSPVQDHVAVLIRPTEADSLTAASLPRDAARAKVKVWKISADVQPGCVVSTPGGMLFHSASQPQMECLR
ncbi:hypothetical protein LSCM1_02725 [Leishmania martiniquensis]|uniref:Uncharacterized protein n=1 Tax=Leishmania martiniquensis TaxID=1580590 RepID=A0A836GT76_9TRYP|nr:hypothetical protein LSCM1_02725 [Leishmania martiniquensis]